MSEVIIRDERIQPRMAVRISTRADRWGTDQKTCRVMDVMSVRNTAGMFATVRLPSGLVVKLPTQDLIIDL